MRRNGSGGTGQPAALAVFAVGTLALALLLVPSAPARASTGEPGARNVVGIAPATDVSYLEYARMALGGDRLVRLPFFWEDIEPAPGGFDWRKTDAAVALAAAAGIRVRPFVMGVPAWVQQLSGSTDYPPVSSAVFKKNWRFLLASLIDRYGPHGVLWDYLKAVAPQIRKQPIRTWQIWNEPNARTYWRPGQSAPAGYAKLLRISAGAVRAHDPGAEVIAAGLFLTPLDGMTMPQFVGQLYRQPGAAANFDALALHPYARNVAGVLKQIRIARQLMADNGDSASQLWITELGWPTQRSYGRGLFVKTEGAQKRLLAKTFSTILSNRQRWRIGSLTWYTWRDNNLFPTCDLCRFSGLFHEDLTPKPAWSAFTHITGGQADVPASAQSSAPPQIPGVG